LLDASEAGLPNNQSFISEDIPLSEDSGSEDLRGTWDNPIEFLLSCLSFAVGLGNIWRFPYLCYRNGGGAFLIPYVISLVFMGLPVFLYEMGVGQFSSEGPVAVWKICPLFTGIGYGMCCISIYIGTYYNVIIAWAFFYIFSSINTTVPWDSCDNKWNTLACRKMNDLNCTGHGGLTTVNGSCVQEEDVSATEWKSLTHYTNNSKMPSDEFFHKYMLGISDGIHELGALRIELALCLLLAWFIVYCALWKGIKSFGKLVYFTALFPYVILIILLIRAVTLPGYMDGIRFYLTPKWEKLYEVQVWADACIQIFFSLGVTWGGMVTLASYNKFRNNVYRDALLVGLGNCMTSFFAGFVIFGIIGFMAHELGVKVEEVAAQGAGLAFIAYPEAVSRMPISPLWSILFFLMLISLGFGTQFSTTETVVTILQDEFPSLRGKNRRWCLLGVCGFMYLGGLLMITEGGMYVLQLVDNHAATYSALILGCMEIGVMSWCYGVDKFLEDLKFMLGFYPYPRLFWKWAWKVVAPMIVAVILILTATKYSGNSYGEYDFPSWANAIGWLITFSSIMFIPLVAAVKICQEQGTIVERIKKLLQPSYEWGPAARIYRSRHGAGYVKQGQDVDGSNMTLATVGSVPNTNTLIQEARECAMEPLDEVYEEDEEIVSSDDADDGLNMKALRAGQEKKSVVSRTSSKKSNK